MNKPLPKWVTFTGVDDRTNLTELEKLADQYKVDGQSLIEWGILFSPSNRDARYPCQQTVQEILSTKGVFSGHFCGGFANNAMQCQQAIPKNLSRIQINTRSLPTFPSAFELFYKCPVIFQSRDARKFPTDRRFQFLYDASGGRGIFPDMVPPRPGFFVGYAGGMGPDTTLPYLEKIWEAGGDGEFYIDMEGLIRTNGWFDIEKVKVVMGTIFP